MDIDKVSSEVALFITDQTERLHANLHRAKTLIDLYNMLSHEYPNSKNIHTTDILRAAVIFIHASLEEFIRSIAIATFPYTNPTYLNEIPLSGLGNYGKTEKFYLGALLKHKDKSVVEIIEESVRIHIGKTTYNNRKDIINFSKTVGVEKKYLKKVLPKLEKMLLRRHQIVHRADRPVGKEQQWIRATPLSPRHVDSWLQATQEFMSLIIGGVVVQKLLTNATINKKVIHDLYKDH